MAVDMMLSRGFHNQQVISRLVEHNELLNKERAPCSY
jgi:hypothetical protein